MNLVQVTITSHHLHSLNKKLWVLDKNKSMMPGKFQHMIVECLPGSSFHDGSMCVPLGNEERS